MIIPSLISPFGLYLMWIFSEQAVPQELLEAARVDGASEFRTFWQISLPLLAPGIVTTALFTIVATWNNYFLPLIMLKDADWYPLTIGLNQWKDQASTAGVLVPAEVLAVRPGRRRRQGVSVLWLPSGGGSRDKGITTNRRRHLCRYSHC